jgi:hypothetical protein
VSEGYSRYRDRWGHGLHGQVHWSTTDVVADESFHLLDGRRCRNIRLARAAPPATGRDHCALVSSTWSSCSSVLLMVSPLIGQ